MKTKKNKKMIALGLLIAMSVLYGALPFPDGAQAINSIKDASDTLSDSDLSATGVVHTIDFTTTTAIPNNGYIEIEFDGDFNTILADADINCGVGGVATGAGTRIATCTYAGGILADTVSQIVVSNMTNPATDGDRSVDIRTYDDLDVLLDRVYLLVYIIDDVWMTAHVDPILEFTITGVEADAKQVNGINCDETTVSTSTPFGTLVVNATTTVCQQLNVTTNADDGYIVTVEQDQELTSDSGSNINSFNNAADHTGTVAPGPWASPTNTLDVYNTYGHMGLTSDDQDLTAFTYNDYYNSNGVPNYVGLNDTDPVVVMHHDGPSDGLTQNIGEAFVAYSAEIASLQEAGDYENTLTYIATPTY
jgi:hypothetical protein